MNRDDWCKEFTGDALHDLVLAIEIAIGTRSAGATPLGIAVINLCEDAIEKDRQKQKPGDA